MQQSERLFRQLVAVIRAEAMEEMVAQLRNCAAAPPRMKRSAVVADFKATVARASKAPRMAAVARVLPVASKKNGRRTPESTQALIEQLRPYITKHPAQSITEIAEGMGIAAAELKLPLKRMRESKAVSVKGIRRGSRYTIKG